MFEDDLRCLGSDLFEEDEKHRTNNYTKLERMLIFHDLDVSDYTSMPRSEKSQLWFSFDKEQQQ